MDKKVRKYELIKKVSSIVIWGVFFAALMFIIIMAIMNTVNDTQTLRYNVRTNWSIGIPMSVTVQLISIFAFWAFFAFISNFIIHAICDHVIELHLIRKKMYGSVQDIGETGSGVQADEPQEVSSFKIIMIALFVAIVILALIITIVTKFA